LTAKNTARRSRKPGPATRAASSTFIDTALFEKVSPAPDPRRLMTVARMRAGDKMDSYVMLAKALRLIEDRPWTLAVIGDGPM
ncbi:glycosyltransferase family 1 protein, partial [Rhizobium ruizarguesonis]